MLYRYAQDMVNGQQQQQKKKPAPRDLAASRFRSFAALADGISTLFGFYRAMSVPHEGSSGVRSSTDTSSTRHLSTGQDRPNGTTGLGGQERGGKETVVDMSEKADRPTNHGEASLTKRKGSCRSKVPGMFKGPLDALFPVFEPNALYDSPPSFVSASMARSKRVARQHLFRAIIVFLANFVLMLEPASEQVFGQASFFGMIVAIMLPPTFPVQVFLFVSAMLVLGMCLGWAWGCAAMAAGLKARSQLILAAAVQRAQTSVASATNPDVAYRATIFHGNFLDARSTVVFGVFLGVGTFFFGLIRAAAPKLMLLAIFGTIVVDVMCSYGPLFPVNQYTLATTFLVPTACYIAVALAGTIVLFPRTLNTSWTTDLVDKVLSPILQRSQMHTKLLSTPPPRSDSGSSDSDWSKLGSIVSSTQEASSAGLESLLGMLGMMELEVSYGRLSAKDLKRLVDPLRELHTRSVLLGALWSTVEARFKRAVAFERNAHALDESSISTDEEKPKRRRHAQHGRDDKDASRNETARMQRMRRILDNAERENKHDLAALLPIFADASREMRAANDAALLRAMEWLTTQNEGRWSSFLRRGAPKREEEERLAALENQVLHLENALREYRSKRREAIVEPFRDFFDPATGLLRPIGERGDAASGSGRLFAPGSLFAVLSASDKLVLYAHAVLAFAREIQGLAQQRRRNKLGFPTGLRRIGNLVRGKGPTTNVVPDGDDPDDLRGLDDSDDETTDSTLASGKENKKKGDKAKNGGLDFVDDAALRGCDPDARPPRNAGQRGSLLVYRFFHWWTSPNAVFALKYTAASIVCWLPQVFKSTAWLSYSQKVLWTLITAQTFLAPYSGDQFLSTVQRVIGTAAGLVWGMVIWYVGSANGPGTRPGVGAALFVLMLPLVAARLFAPPASTMIAIMMAVTSSLVVGYSWQDEHLPQYGSPGVGYSVAWRRGLLVIIGAGVAFVFMLLPPQSSRVFVRRTHARCIEELGQLYTSIVSSWIEEDVRSTKEGESAGEDGYHVFTPSYRKAARARMLALRVKLNASKPTIFQSSYEPSLRGEWPQDQYLHLLMLQLGLLQALGQLGQALVRLDPQWRRQLVQDTAFLNQPLIADVTSTFYLISLALRQGSPLPEATPGPLLDRLLYHDRRLRMLTDEPALGHEAEDEHAHAKHVDFEGARMGGFKFTFDVLRDEQFGTYASALEALSNILLDTDELEIAIKGLVGEVHFPGYSALAERQLHAQA
ncbi:fusaric acid resistance-like protein [Rhodotorula toruloides]|uniref:Fusaric acid resistance-like protein n=1 Tax=Rhodotorula toruloides TaxID=5286 RepID=A0A511KR58_RHOTO|nr:fusaric acid resistance-like protein [Rhodotorula toruloides]